MDFGLAAEPVIGPAEGRTRWRRPGMTLHMIRNFKNAEQVNRSEAEAAYLIACGLIGEPVAPVITSGGAQKKNS
jgi:hypothetical protein